MKMDAHDDDDVMHNNFPALSSKICAFLRALL